MARDRYKTALERIERARRDRAITLDLQGLGLTSLPPEIGALTALQALYLHNNQLTTLPPEIGALTALNGLHLDKNQLTTLPPEIRTLAALQTLGVPGNQLTTLPLEIGTLTALQKLWLQNNKLAMLPAALRELPKLEHLYLHDNPGLNLSPSILGPDPRTSPGGPFPSARSILDVYFGRQTASSRPLNEIKLILVGRGAAGKTSIVRALRGEPFREGEESTPGISLSDWQMKGCAKGPVTAHVWDFAGQVITHALHQFFFSVRSLYVLVLTGRENSERQDAEYWLRLIKAFGTEPGEGGNGPPVIVVLNKWDLEGCRPRVDRGALVERYPFIRGFVEADCKTKKGIDELRAVLHREVDLLKWVREPFEETWDDVRRALAKGKESRPHLTYSEFRALCAKHGIADESKQDSLAEVLHNLGAALNYRNDPRLREATVLRPEWLTENVYKLVRRAEAQSGVLTQADVDATLAGVQEPEMRAYLVRLMERFEIAYAASADAGRWLVPQALPDLQPPAAAEFIQAPDATRLRYTYQALPEGLVARAIVRLHEFIEDGDGEEAGKKKQWASGAILVREEARALVRTEPQDRQVMMTVTGPEAARRQLAGLYQAEMRDIHAEIPGLDPLEETQVDGVWVLTATLEEDEKRGRPSGVPTRDRGTIFVNPAVANNAYSQKAARSEEIWKPTIFICYSKSNIAQRKRLESELKMLRNEGLLAGHWHDRMIDPGDTWDDSIKRHLTDADIFLMLASAAALSTDYITKEEIPTAMRMHAEAKIAVVPIILEECRWDKTKLGELQALPEKGKAISKWKPQSGGWKNVADGLAAVCKKLMDARKRR